MKNKIKNLKENEKFQENLQKMKPKRNIWGILGVILFFFVPEYFKVQYSKEIHEWIVNLAQNYPNEQIKEMLITTSSKLFDGTVSILNISLGIAFLVWIFWDDIVQFKNK